MKPKVGQYHYTLRGRVFRIYQYVSVTDTGCIALPVTDEPSFSDREKARKRVYELNGWTYNEK